MRDQEMEFHERGGRSGGVRRWGLAGLLLTLLLLPAAAAAQSAGGVPAQYAIVVNGDDSFTHNRNVEIALSALAKLGYQPANTFVLTANPRQPAGLATVRPASRRSLSETLAGLKARMQRHDLLLIYLTGHGFRFFGRAVLELDGDSVGANALAQEVSALPFDKLILVADQCYSGAFVKAFTAIGRNVVAVSSTDEKHEVRCEPFVRPFWSAAAESADADREPERGANGYVSVEEAFRVGAERLAAGAGGQSGASALYAATGTCKGHDNRFSAGPAAAASRPPGRALAAAPLAAPKPQ
jgi:hypothetical protein